MSAQETIAAVLMCSGTVCVLIGVLAFFRMPDFYSRMHATSIVETLGAMLVIGGLMVHLGVGAPAVKLLLVLLLLLLLNPFTTNALAQAALHGGVQPVLDDADSQPAKDKAKSKPNTKNKGRGKGK